MHLYSLLSSAKVKRQHTNDVSCICNDRNKLIILRSHQSPSRLLPPITMNLTAAVPSVLPSASKDASATTGPDAVHADTSESQPTTVSGIPTREEAIDMIQAARWWSPNLTCNPEPLSTLLSNNAKEESGWLRNLLFPGSIDTAYAADDSNQYQQDLTLAYLLT